MDTIHVSLAKVGVKLEQFPADNKPEFVFCGKSNVGKSSLINTMVNRKRLARTSGNPGKTRTINFYDVNNILYLVDLPGYGYAKMSRKESEKWGKMIENYLINRTQIKSILLLLDIRHEPSTNDKQLYDWLKYYKYEMIIVATKSDKIKRSQLDKHTSIIRKKLEMEKSEILIPFSSDTKAGRDELWRKIEAFIETAPTK